MIKKKAIKKKIPVKKPKKAQKKRVTVDAILANKLETTIASFDFYFKKVFEEMEQIRALVHAHSIGAQNVYNEFLKMKEKFAEMDRHFSRFGIK